jgi:hypothetical protein
VPDGDGHFRGGCDLRLDATQRSHDLCCRKIAARFQQLPTHAPPENLLPRERHASSSKLLARLRNPSKALALSVRQPVPQLLAVAAPAAREADRLRQLRLRSQLLQAKGAGQPSDVARRLCGIQAQIPSAAALGIRARTSGVVAADVAAALERRSLLRTWTLRGTLHVVAGEDVRWLLSLVGPVQVTAAKARFRQLGLDEETSARGIELIRRLIFERGPLLRSKLIPSLAETLKLPAVSRAPFHLVWRAALEGTVCLGPGGHDDDPTIVLLDDWLPPERPPSRDAALGELARRFLAGYGPAQPRDLATWAGLPVAVAHEGWHLLEGRLVELQSAGAPLWMLRPVEISTDVTHQGNIRFLPHFDAYLLGYRNRDFALDPAFASRIQTGGGFLHPVVIADGRVIARWNLSRRGRPILRLEPFEGLDDLAPEIDREIGDIERFFESAIDRSAVTESK